MIVVLRHHHKDLDKMVLYRLESIFRNENRLPAQIHNFLYSPKFIYSEKSEGLLSVE